jgi:hypothetical protein
LPMPSPGNTAIFMRIPCWFLSGVDQARFRENFSARGGY